MILCTTNHLGDIVSISDGVYVPGATDCGGIVLSVSDRHGSVPECWLLSLREPDLQNGWCTCPAAKHVSSVVHLL